jgi:hypothetical protein
MAKRRARRARSGLSVDTLMSELSSLDARRREIMTSIQNAVSSVLGGVPSPFSAKPKRGRPAGSTSVRPDDGGKRRGRPPGSKNVVAAAAPTKRRKMSAKARKAISDAQKKRWAKQKAATR